MTDENRVKAGAAGGIEIVVKALNTHINNADVCFHGCAALMNMIFNNGKNSCYLETLNKQQINDSCE